MTRVSQISLADVYPTNTRKRVMRHLSEGTTSNSWRSGMRLKSFLRELQTSYAVASLSFLCAAGALGSVACSLPSDIAEVETSSSKTTDVEHLLPTGQDQV